MSGMKLLTDTNWEEAAWDNARSVECPQCGYTAFWLYDQQQCFCFFCHYDDADVRLRWWDRIDIHAPILMDGSGVAA